MEVLIRASAQMFNSSSESNGGLMPISDYHKQKVQQWLIDAGRRCPSCKADAEKLLPTDLEESLPLEAVTPHGIDGSVEVHDA